MATYQFTGSSVSFASTTLGRVRSIDYEEGDGEVEVSGSDCTEEEFESTIPSKKITVETVGAAGSLAKGSTGALTVTFNDGTSASLAEGVVVSHKTTGRHKGEILRTLVIRKKASAPA
jgi:hypothetical protein